MVVSTFNAPSSTAHRLPVAASRRPYDYYLTMSSTYVPTRNRPLQLEAEVLANPIRVKAYEESRAGWHIRRRVGRVAAAKLDDSGLGLVDAVVQLQEIESEHMHIDDRKFYRLQQYHSWKLKCR